MAEVLLRQWWTNAGAWPALPSLLRQKTMHRLHRKTLHPTSLAEWLAALKRWGRAGQAPVSISALPVKKDLSSAWSPVSGLSGWGEGGAGLDPSGQWSFMLHVHKLEQQRGGGSGSG